MSTYPMAPLIKYTLLILYLALVLPLPVLAPIAIKYWLLAATLLGFLLVLALVSEEVQLDSNSLKVSYPSWCRWFMRSGWQLPLADIKALLPVATSQAGRVYYLRTKDASFLLPQRVANFPELLANLQRATGINTSSVQRLTPPWTYQLLAVLSALLLAAELLSAWFQGLSWQLVLGGGING